jgi:hypothetical protein
MNNSTNNGFKMIEPINTGGLFPKVDFTTHSNGSVSASISDDRGWTHNLSTYTDSHGTTIARLDNGSFVYQPKL